MERIKEFKSEETFAIENYEAGHSQLLLRNWSNEEKIDLERIDLLFIETFYIELPLNLKGIIISPATQEETYRIKSKHFYPVRQNHKVYAIVSSGERYFVGAAVLDISRYIYQPVGTPPPLGAIIATPNPGSRLYRDREGKLNRVIIASYRISFD